MFIRAVIASDVCECVIAVQCAHPDMHRVLPSTISVGMWLMQEHISWDCFVFI